MTNPQPPAQPSSSPEPTPRPTPRKKAKKTSPTKPQKLAPKTRTRKPQWWEPFEAEIIEYCIKPRLYELLQIGVNSKKELLDQWNEAAGTNISMKQLEGWLESSGLADVFREVKKFRIEPFQPGSPIQLPPQQIPPDTDHLQPEPQGAPAQQFGLPPQAPAGPGAGGAMRRPIPRIPRQDPDEQQLMAAGVTPVIPGMSRRPGGPPGRTSLNHGGQQVPMDYFQ